MAQVKKVGQQFCVVHDTTGAVLNRKGKSVCYATRPEAAADAKATRARVMGKQGLKP